MKLISSIVLWSFLSLLVFSCAESEKTEELDSRSIKINLDKAQTLKVSDHFKLKDVIYFSDSLVVDHLIKSSVVNDKLVLHCGWGLDYLLIKDMKTGAEVAISAKGEGPNQYQKLSDFFINHKGQIELLDGQAGKILTYNLKGELLSVYQNEKLQNAGSFLSLNGEDYFIYGGNFYAGKSGYQMQIWNKNEGKVKSSYIPFDEQKAGFMLFMEPRNFSKNPASFYQVYNQHVYELSEDAVEDSLYLDFGQHNIPAELFENSYQDVREFSQAMAKSGYAYGLGNFLLEENLLFASVRKNEQNFHFYTNTKTGESTVFDKISNDVFGLKTDEKIGYQYRPVAMDGDHIYFLVSMEAQNEHLDEELMSNASKSDLNQRLLSRIQNFEEGDNLAIVKCEITGF
ncbi:6-bladed beta-propeller [Marivirga harenae]|uniref:6-bladed beta-propeller n=1 Tax=Marivirga harenae TaxID=2010992 RepID=UPI0026E0A04A|nr:6-bladed beta-propeller [Marivirga harenae]WKV12519.1 6-bladed beta-propeller [Marivirga harenae]